MNNRIVVPIFGILQGLCFWAITETEFADYGSVGMAILLAVVAFLYFILDLSPSFTESRRKPAFILSALAIGVIAFGSYAVGELHSYGGSGFYIFFNAMCMVFSAIILKSFLITLNDQSDWNVEYTSLCEHSWNAYLVTKIAMIFVGLCWALYGLAAVLFGMLSIDFLKDLAREELFSWTFSGAMFGLGHAVAHEYNKMIRGLRFVVFALFRILFVPVCVVMLLFLVALGINGFSSVEKFGSLTGVMLAIIAAGIIMLNGVYQTDGVFFDKPVFRIGGLIGTASIFMFSCVAVYAIGIRTLEYGLSPSRVVASMLVFIAIAYSLSYFIVFLLTKKSNFKPLSSVNVALALMVVSLCILLNLPKLNPLSLSASNQYSRLINGDVSAENFDYQALRWDFGKSGNAVLKELSEFTTNNHTEADVISVKAKEVLAKEHRYTYMNKDEMSLKTVDVHPIDKSIPDALYQLIETKDYYGCKYERDREGCIFVVIDVDEDGSDEFILFSSNSSGDLYDNNEGVWEQVGEFSHRCCAEDIKELLKETPAKVVEPDYKSILIGEKKFGFRVNYY